MPAATTSWTPAATAPISKRARRGSLWRPQGVESLNDVQLSLGLGGKSQGSGPGTSPSPSANASPLRQLVLGSEVFAGILAVSVPLIFVSKGLALGAAIGLGVLLVALLARRLLLTTLIAAVLAILGALATAQSVHASHADTVSPIPLGAPPPAVTVPANARRS